MSKTLRERVMDEADLCRNDGADDIARLLDEVAAALADQAQPVRQPLTTEERREIIMRCDTIGQAIHAVERAHGITGEPAAPKVQQ